MEQAGGRGRVVAGLVRDPNRSLATIQIGITLAGFLASAAAAVSLAEPRALFAGRPLTALAQATRPAAWLLSKTSDVVVRVVGADPEHSGDVDDRGRGARHRRRPGLLQRRAAHDHLRRARDRRPRAARRARPPRPSRVVPGRDACH